MTRFVNQALLFAAGIHTISHKWGGHKRSCGDIQLCSWWPPPAMAAGSFARSHLSQRSGWKPWAASNSPGQCQPYWQLRQQRNRMQWCFNDVLDSTQCVSEWHHSFKEPFVEFAHEARKDAGYVASQTNKAGNFSPVSQWHFVRINCCTSLSFLIFLSLISVDCDLSDDDNTFQFQIYHWIVALTRKVNMTRASLIGLMTRRARFSTSIFNKAAKLWKTTFSCTKLTTSTGFHIFAPLR